MVEAQSLKNWITQSRPGSIEKYYDIKQQKVLGQGQFGTALSMKVFGTEEYRAVKVVPKKRVQNPSELIREIELHQKLHHPNVIKLHEVFEDSRNLYLVLEQCNGGELFDKISDAGQLSENDARNLFRQIAKAVSYCHANNICHRDLKPENFLLSTKEDDSPIKIIDFGLSCIYMEENKRLNLSLKAGSVFYIAPEVLKGNYNELCDVWSLGVILFIMLSGLPPFFGKNDPAIFKMISAIKYSFDIPQFDNVSESAKDLIRKCLVVQEDRISASKLLEHPWMLQDLPTIKLDLSMEKLKGFTTQQKLKKVFLNIIAQQMSEKEIKDLGELFRKMDINNDGVISLQEMQIHMKKQGAENDEIEKAFKAIDQDNSGSIDYNEFLVASMDYNIYTKQDNLYLTFKMLDVDGSGKISVTELSNALKNDRAYNMQTEAYWKDLIKEADKNKDGEIDYAEFVDLIKKL